MKISKSTLKQIIKEEINNLQEAEQKNPFMELHNAKEAFKAAMELCNISVGSPEYRRLRTIRTKILEGLMSSNELIKILQWNGKSLNDGFLPITPSDKVFEPPKED